MTTTHIRQTRRLTAWLVAGTVLAALLWLLQASDLHPPFTLVIDGEEVIGADDWSLGDRLGLVLGLGIAALVALLVLGVVLPMALGLVVVAVVVAVLAGVGLPVLLVAGVVLLLLSPLLLLAWILWKLVS